MFNEAGDCVPCNFVEGYKYPYYRDDSVPGGGYCTEICGDGANLGQYECDDFNNKDGDGCSSTC